MNKFKRGDLVTCIDPADDCHKGRVYVVANPDAGIRRPKQSFITVYTEECMPLMQERFELVADVPRPEEWLKAAIVKADKSGDDTSFMTRMLRECYSIEARAKNVTTWTFEQVTS